MKKQKFGLKFWFGLFVACFLFLVSYLTISENLMFNYLTIESAVGITSFVTAIGVIINIFLER